MNSRRMNRLEELGRVDAEKAKTRMGKRNLKDEKKRLVRELKADGGLLKEDPMRDRKKQPLRTKSGGKKTNPFDPNKDPKKRRTEGYKMGGKVQRKQKAQPKTPRDQQRQRRMGDRSKPKGIRIMEVRKKDGGKIGGLKKPTPNQKGLKKLPTTVRNKMGYMKKGGRVGMGKALRGGGCVR